MERRLRRRFRLRSCQMRMDVMRTLFDEQRRQEMRKKSFQPTEGKPQAGLKLRSSVAPESSLDRDGAVRGDGGQ